MNAGLIWFSVSCGLAFMLLVSLTLIRESIRMVNDARADAEWERDMRMRCMYERFGPAVPPQKEG